MSSAVNAFVASWPHPWRSDRNGIESPGARFYQRSFRRPSMPEPTKKPLNDEALDLIFRKARTHSAWQAKPVDAALLQQVYDLAKMGPTSANMCPMRIVFVQSAEAKEKLKPALDPGNV